MAEEERPQEEGQEEEPQNRKAPEQLPTPVCPSCRKKVPRVIWNQIENSDRRTCLIIFMDPACLAIIGTQMAPMSWFRDEKRIIEVRGG